MSETGAEFRITYRFLRWLMALLPLVLFVVTTTTALQQGHLEGSISAYYGGPVRDVFVGVLVATAACMIAYKGSSMLEDYTLNGAGFYAVFVALVPSNLAATLDALRANTTPDGVTAGDYVWFLRISLTTVLALCGALLMVEIKGSNRLAALWSMSTTTKAFIISTSAVLTAFLGLAMWQLWVPGTGEVTMSGVGFPGGWRLRIHDIAAILLIAALAVAVWSHAFPSKVTDSVGHDDKSIRTYKVILGAMVLGLPVAGLFYAFVSKEHTVIFLEWWEILTFCSFWIKETQRTRTSIEGA